MRRCGHNPTDIEVSDIINKIHNDTGSLDEQVSIKYILTEVGLDISPISTLAPAVDKVHFITNFSFWQSDNYILERSGKSNLSIPPCVKMEIPGEIRKCLREQKSNLVLNPIQLYQRQNIENPTTKCKWTKPSQCFAILLLILSW